MKHLHLHALILLLASCGGGKFYSEEASFRGRKVSKDNEGSYPPKSPLVNIESRVAISLEMVAANTELVGVFKYDVLKAGGAPANDIITSQVRLPANVDSEVIHNEFVQKFAIRRAISSEELKTLVKNNPAVVAIAIDDQLTGHLQQISNTSNDRVVGFSPKVKTAIQDLTGGGNQKRVKVAVIDSGLDSSSTEFKSVFLDPRLTDVLNGSNSPTDSLGHGTQIASIVGSKSFGLVESMVEILPLKITEVGQINVSDVLKAIIVGTNLGADVINMSLGTENAFGCTPLVGHVMSKAIEKGVFFSISAGNGTRHTPETPVGFPLTAASDDGPLNFQRTSMPGCWGKYFLGAVAVGAVEEDGSPDKLKMPLFSNYGPEVELGAPGVSVASIGLKGAKTTITGTSASAAYVTAAAALAIYHQRSKGIETTPWYIENLLVESARKTSIQEVERRTRFGSVLDFEGLINLLHLTEQMSADQRAKIPTINPRTLDGWIPGRESRLNKLTVQAPTNSFKPASTTDFKSIVLFMNGTKEQEVTKDKNTNWALSFANEDDLKVLGSISQYASLSSKNIIHLNDAAIRPIREKLASARRTSVDKVSFVDFKVLSVFDEAQSQVVGILPAKLLFDESSTAGGNVEIRSQSSAFRVGQTDNWFKLFLSETLPDGSTVSTDVTGGATWTSSNPGEFTPLLAAGVFSSEAASLGASYTVTATYQGKNVSKSIAIEKENVTAFEVANSLGSVGSVTIGQVFKLTSNLVFESRQQPVKSDWFMGTTKLASAVPELVIDTSKMDSGLLKAAGFGLGANQITAKSIVKEGGTSKDLTASHTVTMTREVGSIEVMLKDPIVKEGGELLLNLKVNYDNNSNQIITGDPELQWSATPSSIVSIQANGKATVAANSAFTKVVVTAKYKGKTDDASFYIVSGNPITGSKTDLIDLELVPDAKAGTYFCTPPKVSVFGIYKDGQRREVTSVSSFATQIINAGQVVNSPKPKDYVGGATLRTTVAYNDGANGKVMKDVDVLIGKANLDVVTLKRGVNPKYYQSDRVQGKWFGEVAASSCQLDLTADVKTKYFDSVTYNLIPGAYTVSVDWSTVSMGSLVSHHQDLPFSVDADTLAVILSQQATKNDSIVTTGGQTVVSTQEGVFPWDPEKNGIAAHFRFLAGDDLSSLLKLRQYVPLVTELFSEKVTLNGVTQKSTSKRTGSIKEEMFVGACIDKSVASTVNLKLTNQTGTISGDISYSILGTPNLDQETSLTKGVPELAIPNMPATYDYCNADNLKKTPAAGGTGTESDPFRICSPQQLMDTYNFLASNSSSGSSIALEDDLDFKGITPTFSKPAFQGIDVDGKNHTVTNFFFVDAERDYVGIFPRLNKLANLKAQSIVVRGRDFTGAMCGECQWVSKVFVTDSTVSGSSQVGGIAGKSNWLLSSGMLNSSIYSLMGISGGLAGSSHSVHNSFAQGQVLHIGVPGLGYSIGGIVGEVINVFKSRFAGTVSGSQEANIVRGIGGIAGLIGFTAIYNVAEGVVTNAGSGVGGIAGVFNPHDGFSHGFGKPFEVKSVDLPFEYFYTSFPPLDTKNQRMQALIGNSFKGTIIGGKSREQLFCLEGLKEVLGPTGSIKCDGDLKAISQGSGSAAGGLVGSAHSLYARDNQSDGVVRSSNQSGGIFGNHLGFAPFLNNEALAQVTVSDQGGVAGKYFGSIKSKSCEGVIDLSKTTAGFVKGNKAQGNQPTVKDVGRFDTINGPLLNLNFQ